MILDVSKYGRGGAGAGRGQSGPPPALLAPGEAIAPLPWWLGGGLPASLTGARRRFGAGGG